MNTEEKLRLIFEDEKIRVQEEQNKLDRLSTVLDGPSTPSQILENSYQTEEVPITDKFQRVFEHENPAGQALIITEIGNDWYPGVEWRIKIDGEIVGDELQLEISPTESPKEVEWLCRDKVVWQAKNTGSEPRDLGVVNNGHYIPMEAYREYASIYDEFGGNLSEDIWPEAITIPSSSN